MESSHWQTASKISQRLGILKRIRQYIDQDTMNMLYNATILPHIDYCFPIWSSPANKLVNKIQIWTGAGVHSGNTGQECGIIFLPISNIPPVCRYLKRAWRSLFLTQVHKFAPFFFKYFCLFLIYFWWGCVCGVCVGWGWVCVWRCGWGMWVGVCVGGVCGCVCKRCKSGTHIWFCQGKRGHTANWGCPHLRITRMRSKMPYKCI